MVFPISPSNIFFYRQGIRRDEKIQVTELAGIIGVSKPTATAKK